MTENLIIILRIISLSLCAAGLLVWIFLLRLIKKNGEKTVEDIMPKGRRLTTLFNGFVLVNSALFIITFFL